jgi:hypothetical protein
VFPASRWFSLGMKPITRLLHKPQQQGQKVGKGQSCLEACSCVQRLQQGRFFSFSHAYDLCRRSRIGKVVMPGGGLTARGIGCKRRNMPHAACGVVGACGEQLAGFTVQHVLKFAFAAWGVPRLRQAGCAVLLLEEERGGGGQRVCAKRTAAADDQPLKLHTLSGGSGGGGGGITILHWHE